MKTIKCQFFFAVFSFILLSLDVNGQNISVSSFKLIENDLTANTTGTMESDQNGETAALIKVVTSETGFSFDGGMVGIVKTKQEVGEIWVYTRLLFPSSCRESTYLRNDHYHRKGTDHCEPVAEEAVRDIHRDS